MLQQVVALLQQGGGAWVAIGGEDAIASQIDEKGIIVTGMGFCRQGGQQRFNLRQGASPVTLGQGDLRQASLRFGGHGGIAKLLEGG